MNHHRKLGLRATGIAVATTASLAVAGLAGSSYASGNGASPARTPVQAPRSSAGHSNAGTFVDVTEQGLATRIQNAKRLARAQAGSPVPEGGNAPAAGRGR